MPILPKGIVRNAVYDKLGVSSVDKPNKLTYLEIQPRFGYLVETESVFPIFSNEDLEQKLSATEVREIIAGMDTQFKPLEKTASEKEIRSPFFIKHQVAIKNPSASHLTITHSVTDDKKSSQLYSIILDFSSAAHLRQFMNMIPEQAKQAAAPGLYVIFQCSYDVGSYKLMVLPGKEYPALNLLLGQNALTMDLPITHFLLEKLKPPSFLSFNWLWPRPAADNPDELYSAVLAVMQHFVVNHGEGELDTQTSQLLNINPQLHSLFLATQKYCSDVKWIEPLLNRHLLWDLSNIVLSYRGRS